MSEICTADHIRDALVVTYTTPEWYIGFEVGDSTGANCTRHADAVAVNAYPSKGFETRGFEIKVSKQDLAAELNNGAKSDAIAKYCDYWFLVTPKGLSDGFTLPPTWGVIEYHNGKLRQKTRAQKLEKTPPTKGFMCAMLRARERAVLSLAVKLTADREEQIKRDALYRAGSAETQLKKLKQKLDEIKSSTGISLDSWTPTQAIIDRLNTANSIDIINANIYLIKRASESLIKSTKDVEEAIAVLRKPVEADCDKT